MKELSIAKKYTLSVDEAAEYFGIGSKRIRQIIHDNPKESFVLSVGTQVRVKRILFEKYLDEATAV